MPPDVFEAAETPGADVASACETLSFGGLRLVIVRGADAWRADDAAPLVTYLASPNPGTCLALVCEGVPTPKLKAAAETAGRILVYGPDPKARRSDRTKWFVDHLVAETRRHGASIPVGVAREVVARVGEDAMALGHEAAKLAAAAGAEPVTRELVESLSVENPEARAYELADAIVARNSPRAYEVLHELGSGDKPADPAVIHSTLARHFRGIALAQSLGTDVSVDAVSEATGLKGYPAQKALEHARATAPRAGERCVARLATLELDLRVSALADLGRTGDDGRRFVLEQATRDLLAIVI